MNKFLPLTLFMSALAVMAGVANAQSRAADSKFEYIARSWAVAACLKQKDLPAKAIMEEVERLRTNSKYSISMTEMHMPMQEMTPRFTRVFIYFAESSSVQQECRTVASRMTNKNQSSRVESREKAHNDCLNATDYEGCIRVKAQGIGEGINREGEPEYCEDSGWCIAKEGRDRFNMKKKVGWMYREFDDGDILYANPVIRRIPHNGDMSRYVGQEQVFRYYSEPVAPTTGTVSTIGSADTSCTGYGNYITCKTTPPAQIRMPGTKGSAGGIRSIRRVLVIDCKDKTQALYVNGKLRGSWEKTNIYSDIFKECATASEASPLFMQL